MENPHQDLFFVKFAQPLGNHTSLSRQNRSGNERARNSIDFQQVLILRLKSLRRSKINLATRNLPLDTYWIENIMSPYSWTISIYIYRFTFVRWIVCNVWDCERPLTASSCWKPFHKTTGDPKSCRITEQLNNSVTGWRLHMKARTGSSSSTEGTSGWTTRFRYCSRRAVTRVQSPATVRPGWTPQTVRVAAGSGRKPSAVATWHEEQRQIWLVHACVWQTDRQTEFSFRGPLSMVKVTRWNNHFERYSLYLIVV